MRLETFQGRNPSSVLADVRTRLGDEAMIIRTRTRRDGGEPIVEVVATTTDELELFQQRLLRAPMRVAASGPGSTRDPARPRVVALVGPTGAGKTTTMVKLALHPDAFGGRRVGLITLDTYRAGALEQLQTYADVAELPLEVIYGEAEVDVAMRRLRHCEVVLVDTPGRSPRHYAAGARWSALLRRIDPDEVHLTVPAGLRADVALAARESYASCGITHALLTKLDEVPGEQGVAELADRLNLPAHWVATGQELPDDLAAAAPRLLASLCGENAFTSKTQPAG